LLNVALVAASLVAAIGGYLQEKKALEAIRRLGVAEARALHDRALRRRERTMIAVTAALVLGAAAALASRLAP
jgi:hypothetical protein